ncbi:MAG TPA: tRNA lysidine(34) synthetase [Streptosporangiaceae bacterium]|nr:tRNA lysidine(34) synthetase [Streptosporangiaceae bacterium]
MGPHPAVAAVRRAVRASLAGLEPGDLVLAACSGGADSLALAAALAFEGPRAGLLAGGVTVDHGLQPGSADRARHVVEVMTGLGLGPALSVAVTVATPGSRGSSPLDTSPSRPADPYPGPEAAARRARYAALDGAAEATGAVAVLLGHTLDDQAETVLLGLARGSGARSLAGMARSSGRYLRPLLGIRREHTEAACAVLGLEPWDDPQNFDPALTRTRVRGRLMPALAEALGPGVPEALARTADLLRADADALDAIAAAEAGKLGGPATVLTAGWPAPELAAMPEAIRHRLLRLAALAAGCPAGTLSHRHVTSIDGLVTGWHGQRWADLPGGVRCRRRYGRLLFTATAVVSPADAAVVPGVVPPAGPTGVPGVGPRASTTGVPAPQRDRRDPGGRE